MSKCKCGAEQLRACHCSTTLCGADTKVVWHIVWAIILLWGLWQDFGIWKTALAPSPYGVVETAQGELAQSGKQAWMLDGTRYEADHATSTSPDFGAVNVTGYDSQNNVIWAVHAVNVIQRVK